jgi:plasmid stability protein
MPVDLTIENARDAVVQRVRDRAAQNRRSLRDEVLTIIEAAVDADRPLTPSEVLAQVRRVKLATPAEAGEIVRADRDAR